ncbi:Cullin-domain-containing protein [Xylariales sp. AK1849]|nr:Cullin-domain-containing protein [Xylariales sp. AK1849]
MPPTRNPELSSFANLTIRQNPAAAANVDGFDYNWGQLQSALKDIHEKNASALAFEQLYRHAYKIVLKKMGEQLYDRVKEFEQKWFADHVIPPIFAVISKNLISVTLGVLPGTSAVERRAMGDKFLLVIRESWEHHNMSMNMIADILMYLDRGYTHDNSRPTIFATTIGLFRDHILRTGLQSDGTPPCTVFGILNATIIDQINMERQGDVIDKALLRSCLGMLESLHETDDENENEKLYVTMFEPEYLRKSREYYRAECEKLLRDSDAATWLRYTQQRLDEEAARCQTTISIMTQDSIAKVVEEELIRKHLEEFMNLDGSGVRAMIDNDRTDDLAILYQLVCRVDPKREALRKALTNRVVELGMEIEKVLRNTDFSTPQVTAEEEPAAGRADKPKPKALNPSAQQTASALKWVDDVLSLKDRFDTLWSCCFAQDLILQTALTKSFSEFINTFDRSSEFLSLFIDDNLKRGIKDKTEEEIDIILEKAITLLRYISEKDKFELYYQKHLARRLLQQKSERHDIETEMISRMKRELGNNFTYKFEGMFKDMNLSKDESESYSKHVRGLGESDEKRVELSINILGGNNWPKDIMGRQTGLGGQDRADMIYPREIKGLQDSFFEFYSKTHQGRKLNWVGTAGTADIRCVFPKIPGKTSGPLSRERRYELNVTTYGMIVLLLFNDLPEGQWLKFDEVQAKTNIPQSDLINVLTSLSVIKATKVLLKEPATKAIVKIGDRFTFNREFTSKAIKIKMASVNAANKVENDDERKATDDKANEIRKYLIDAAVVRIMKQRKLLSHSQLITEVIQQLASQFKPDVSAIKGRIEDLISREYLERAEAVDDGKAAYRYVA